MIYDYDIPFAVFIDAYKASHAFLFPPAEERQAYGEFRRSFNKDHSDHRILFYGLRHVVDRYVARRWTIDDVKRAADFFKTLNVGQTPYPFPEELLTSIVKECDGWFPVKIMGLPEGSVIYPHTPVYTITAKDKYACLVTWLETLLTMVWYPTTVATLSRRTRSLIKEFFDQSVEQSQHCLLDSGLQDFGFRGCASLEQALLGGSAHLLSFISSDTAIAAYHVQYNLNGGIPLASTIPSTEHSVMLSHKDELSAINRIMQEHGERSYGIVMDTYDYAYALKKILPVVREEKIRMGGLMVIQPDSGDPIESVLMGLGALEKVFGVQINALGYKVLNRCSVIQGDGIDYETIRSILEAVLAAGFSAQNVVFGMGSGLLQRVNRDTMSFATKLCYQRTADGHERDICKTPKADNDKTSLPGRFALRRNNDGCIIVYPDNGAYEGEEVMQVYYDHGKVEQAGKLFSELRTDSIHDWEVMPKIFDPVSRELKDRQQALISKNRAKLAQLKV